MADVDKVSLRDKKLLELAANGATGIEMQDVTGMPAAQAVQRVKEILSVNRTAYDAYERRELAMLSLLRLKSQMEQQGVDTNNPKHVESYTKLNTAIDKMSLNNEKVSEDDLNKVTEAQARKLLQLIEGAYGYARLALKEEYGEFIDLAVIDVAFQEGLRRVSSSNELTAI
jgi:hypothetical protein